MLIIDTTRTLPKKPKAIKLKGIQATIRRNLRDTMSSPKILLTDIIGLNREHCWVKLTDELAALQPTSNRKSTNIQFDCMVQEYTTYRTNETKLGIISISNLHKR